MDKTPSDIEIDGDSDRRKYDSHESLGYKRNSGKSYSLAKSPTPPNPELSESLHATGQYSSGAQFSDPPSAINDVETTSIGPVGDTSLASLSRINDTQGPSTLTRILENAAEQEALSSQSQRFAAFPPQRVSHRDYPEYCADLGDPALSYTQVLIWCLQRRIDSIHRNPPRELTTSRLLALERILKVMQTRLVDREIALRYHTHDLLRLKPTMKNSENERSRQILEDLAKYKNALTIQRDNAWQLLKASESKLSQEPQTPADQVSRADHDNRYALVHNEAQRAHLQTLKSTFRELTQIDQLNAVAIESALENYS